MPKIRTKIVRARDPNTGIWHDLPGVVSVESIRAAERAAVSEANAELAKEAAIEAKEDAQTAEANAETAESNAEAWSKGTRGGVPVEETDPAWNSHAKYFRDQAATSAEAAAESEAGAASNMLDAEAYAVGTRNDVPVGPTDPAYHNNAKWYTDFAGGSVHDAVYDWMGDHPTERVLLDDGSLTEAKFSDALKLKTIKDYVTPEMFGAVGDGVTDDSAAVLEAVSTKKTVIFFNKYYTSGFVINLSQHILNFGTLILTSPIIFCYTNGSGVLNNSFEGGYIKISNSAAFKLISNEGTIRRFTIKNVNIFGGYNENCKAIETDLAQTSKYITFCTIENIKVYYCYSGFYGYIRASKISMIIEQSCFPMKIFGELNIIEILGQAMDRTIAGNDTVIDLTGSANTISGSFYDVNTGNMQKYFLHINGANSRYNKLNYDLKSANTLIDSNEYKEYWGFGTHDESTRIDKSVLTDENVIRTNISTFNLSNFLSDNLSGYTDIVKSTDAEEGIIDIILPQRKMFYGFKALYFSAAYTPRYFEIYRNDVLVDRRLVNDSIIEWYPRTYEKGYSNPATTYIIRLGIVNNIRQFKINFYGK